MSPLILKRVSAEGGFLWLRPKGAAGGKGRKNPPLRRLVSGANSVILVPEITIVVSVNAKRQGKSYPQFFLVLYIVLNISVTGWITVFNILILLYFLK